MRKLQVQTLSHATLQIGNIHPFSKIDVTFESMIKDFFTKEDWITELINYYGSQWNKIKWRDNFPLVQCSVACLSPYVCQLLPLVYWQRCLSPDTGSTLQQGQSLGIHPSQGPWFGTGAANVQAANVQHDPCLIYSIGS